MKKNTIKRISLAAATLGLAVGGTGLVLVNHANASSTSTKTQKTNKKTLASLTQAKITQEQAISKFTEKYGNKSISEIELEAHKDKVIYKIEGFDTNKEYKMAVDAATGKVIKSETENRDKNDKETALDLSKLITSSQAQEIAKKQANGEAVEVSLENENGKAVWKVKLLDTTAKTMTRVRIDATSQKVLEVDKRTRKDHEKHDKDHDKDHKKSLKNGKPVKDKEKHDRDHDGKDEKLSKSENTEQKENTNSSSK